VALPEFWFGRGVTPKKKPTTVLLSDTHKKIRLKIIT